MLLNSIVLRIAFILISTIWGLNAQAVSASSENPQGAIWRLREAGQTYDADQAENHLSKVLTTNPLNDISKLGDGVSNSFLVRFSGRVYAVLKEADPDYPKSYNSELAAYRLDRLFDLNLVPLTVLREVDGKTYSVQLFYPKGVRGDAKDNDLLTRRADLYMFDYLISNGDRGLSSRKNVLLGEDGRLVAIDHGRAFIYVNARGVDPLDLHARPTKEFRDRLMSLTANDISLAVADLLTASEVITLQKKLAIIQDTIRQMPQQFIPYRTKFEVLDKIRPFPLPQELQSKEFYDYFGIRQMLRQQTGSALSDEVLNLTSLNLPLEAKKMVISYTLDHWSQWSTPLKKQALEVMWPSVFEPMAIQQPSLVGEILRLKKDAFQRPFCSKIFY